MSQMVQPKFIPKPGQVDFTNIRYCPVTNCVLKYKDKLLVVQRSVGLRLYPGYWNGISGFLDDHKSIEEKVLEELNEEAGLSKKDVKSIKVGKILIQESDKYSKTWIVFPILVEVTSDTIILDWEAKSYKWIRPNEVKNFDLLPGFKEVLIELVGKSVS